MKMQTIKMKKMKGVKLANVEKFKTANINAKVAGAPTMAKADAYGDSGKKRMAEFNKRFK